MPCLKLSTSCRVSYEAAYLSACDWNEEHAENGYLIAARDYINLMTVGDLDHGMRLIGRCIQSEFKQLKQTFAQYNLKVFDPAPGEAKFVCLEKMAQGRVHDGTSLKRIIAELGLQLEQGDLEKANSVKAVYELLLHTKT